MKVILGHVFKRGRLNARKHYASISQGLVDDFDHQVKAVIRTINDRNGGDHVGPHGYPCRRCPPFPYLVYYRIEGATLLILGLVHERSHPDHLRRRLEGGAD